MERIAILSWSVISPWVDIVQEFQEKNSRNIIVKSKGMWKYKKDGCNSVQRCDEVCRAFWIQYWVTETPGMLIIMRVVTLKCCSWENLQHLETKIYYHNFLWGRNETLCLWNISTGIGMWTVRDQVSSSFLPWCIATLRHCKIYAILLQFSSHTKLLWNWVMPDIQVLKKPTADSQNQLNTINYVNFSWTI